MGLPALGVCSASRFFLCMTADRFVLALSRKLSSATFYYYSGSPFLCVLTSFTARHSAAMEFLICEELFSVCIVLQAVVLSDCM